MAAPVLASSTLDVTTSGQTSHSISKPSGVTEGDLLVLLVSFEDNTGTVTPPSGFTELDEVETVDSGPVFHNFIWYKIAGNSEPSSYSIGTANSVNGGLSLLRITGASTNLVVSNDSGVLNSADPYQYPSLNVINDESLVFHFGVLGVETFSGYPSGDTAVTTFSYGGYPSDIAISYEENNAGSTGVETTAVSGSGQDWVAFTFAVPPSINNNITLNITGHLPDNNNITLFILGGTEDEAITLFEQGHEVASGNTTLFEQGYDVSSSSISLFIHGHEPHSSSIPLFILGGMESGLIPLFIEGHLPDSGSMPLYVFGSFIDASGIDLFINGHIEDNTSMPLFIESPETIDKSRNFPLFIYSTTNSGLFNIIPLHMGNDDIWEPDTRHSLNLFIKAGDGDDTANMPLFICNDTSINEALTLYLHNEYIESGSGINLFVQSPSGTDGAIPVTSPMNLFINREGEDMVWLPLSLFIQSAEPSNSSIPMYVDGVSGTFNQVALYMSGIGIENKNVRLYTHGF